MFNGINSNFASSLFSTNTSNTNNNSNLLMDYYSIKNGSYKKLLNAYYGKNNNTANNQSYLDKIKAKSQVPEREISKAEKDSSALKASAAALVTKGTNSLFNLTDIKTKDADGNEITEKGYDVDKIHSAVKKFVEDYNAMIDSADKAGSIDISKEMTSLFKLASGNKKAFEDIGITIGKDNKLTMDADKFKESDMKKVASLFNGVGSFGYSASKTASEINRIAVKDSLKATYNNNAQYSNNFNAGNLFSSFF